LIARTILLGSTVIGGVDGMNSDCDAWETNDVIEDCQYCWTVVSPHQPKQIAAIIMKMMPMAAAVREFRRADATSDT
jgi:hypothetical protein